MRAAVPLLLLLLAPLAAAGEDFVVLRDWEEGRSLVGTTAWLAPPTAHVLGVDVDACHPRLLLDLLYDPSERTVALEDVGEAAVSYRYAVQVRQAGAIVGERLIASPGYGHPIAVVPEAGPVEVRFWLAEGADVSWEARVRGRLAIDDPACQDPL